MKFTISYILTSLCVIPVAFVAATTGNFAAAAMKGNKITSSQSLHREQALYKAEHRELQSDVGLQDLCESFLDLFFGPNSGCVCVPTADGTDFEAECGDLFDNCPSCETLQGQETCLKIDVDAAKLVTVTEEEEVSCQTYISGVFDNTICEARNLNDNNCTLTIDGAECSSCEVVTCGVSNAFEENLNMDCSNVIAGETFNLCTDTIPETSRFIYLGNNVLYTFAECLTNGIFGDASDGTIRSFHLFAIVGLAVASLFY